MCDPEEIPYDPASAGAAEDLESISSPDSGEEIYDPESAFSDEPVVKKPREEKKKKRDDVPVFSPEDSTSTSATKTETPLAEQLARLQRQLDAHKRQLEEKKKETKVKSAEQATAVPGFQDLPAGIASILFGDAKDKNGSGNSDRDPRKRAGGNSSSTSDKSSTLGSMTDEDLLAKAAQQLADMQKPESGSGRPEVAVGSMSVPPPAFPNVPTFIPPPAIGSMPPNFPLPQNLDMRPPGYAAPGWHQEGQAPSGSWSRSRGAGHPPADRGQGDWHQGSDRGWNRPPHPPRREERYDDGRRQRGGGWSDRHDGDEFRDRKRRNGSHDEDRRGRNWGSGYREPGPPGDSPNDYKPRDTR